METETLCVEIQSMVLFSFKYNTIQIIMFFLNIYYKIISNTFKETEMSVRVFHANLELHASTNGMIFHAIALLATEALYVMVRLNNYK